MIQEHMGEYSSCVRVNVLLSKELVDETDAVAAALEKGTPGQRVTRTDVIRRALLLALPQLAGKVAPERRALKARRV